MKMKAVLFDFDGVVVQSEPLHRKTFLDVLRPFGIDVSEERWFREFAGTGSKNIITVLAGEAGINRDIEELVEIRKKVYAEHVKKGELQKTGGVEEFLKKLEDADIERAVVSGGHEDNIKLALEILGLEKYFQMVIGAGSVSKRKPDPECYLTAAERFKLNPKECMVIEDSIAGSEAAKRAGMKLVVVKSPVSERITGYDAIITDFKEFPEELLWGK